MAHEVLKTAPRATRRTTPDRAASVQGHSDDEDLAGRGVAGHPQDQDRVVTTLRAGVPLNQWLLRNVG